MALVALSVPAGHPNAGEVLAGWRPSLRDLLNSAGGPGVFAEILTYLWGQTKTSVDQLLDIAADLGPRAEEIALNTAQLLRSEGRAEGRSEGRAELLTDMLTHRFGTIDDTTRERIAHATDDKIASWSGRLIDGATTLDDVLAD